MRSHAALCVGTWVLALAATAAAHEWVDTSRPEGEGELAVSSPSTSDAAAGITGVYTVTVREGQSIALAIVDRSGCKAQIPLESTTGKAAKLNARFGKDLVVNQLITIEGRSRGTTTAIIPVRGEDTVAGNSSGSCTEDTRNKLIVNVVPGPASLERDFAVAWKPLRKDLQLRLNATYATTRSEIRSTVAELSREGVDIEETMMDLYRVTHAGLVMQQSAMEDALGGLKSGGADILSGSGIPEDCPPDGFLAGTGGIWDEALRYCYLSGFRTLTAIDREMLRARGKVEKLTQKGVINAQMSYQPGELHIPAYSPPSVLSDPGTPSRHKLQIQLYGGLTFQENDHMTGCLWFGGRHDSSRGTPTATLTDPYGATITQSVTPGSTSADSWSANFEDVRPGLTYRFAVMYPDESAEESCALSLPWRDLNPSLVINGSFKR